MTRSYNVELTLNRRKRNKSSTCPGVCRTVFTCNGISVLWITGVTYLIYSTVWQIVIKCVRVAKRKRYRGKCNGYNTYSAYYIYIYIYLFVSIFFHTFFPHELIVDLRRMIAHKRHSRRSQKEPRLSGPVRNIHGRIYRLFGVPVTRNLWARLKGWRLWQGVKRIKWRQRHRLVTAVVGRYAHVSKQCAIRARINLRI